MYEKREDIIARYIDAYNRFDADAMLTDFSDTIHFQNISNGQINLELHGLDAFRNQAEQMKGVFSHRKQTIKSIVHKGDEAEVDISYHAVLATDLPNGLKRGTELNLEGKSVFRFTGNKIVSLQDVS